jgi:CubicO group peptidase (beta-lactamase class C family)
MDWTEHYKNPFGITARLNYGNNVGETILSQKITKPSGVEFKYSSGDIQLLGMVIEKATGKRLAHYLSEKFWQPMGAVNDALWQLDDDENKLAKSYCCISSNARDFARFGKLYKDYGKWNGKQLLDSVFVAKSIKPRFKDSPQYGYGWWLHKISGKDFFMMHGLLGQYVMVQPNDNLIIVRLGHSKPPNAVNGVGTNTEDLVTYIEETYKMLGDDK